MHRSLKFLSVLLLALSSSVFAGSLTLTSQDISEAKFMSKDHEFNGLVVQEEISHRI